MWLVVVVVVVVVVATSIMCTQWVSLAGLDILTVRQAVMVPARYTSEAPGLRENLGGRIP